MSDQRYIKIRDVIGATINSLELIPLCFYKPGGVSLTLYIFSESESCSSCPWSEYYGSRRVFDYSEIDVERVLKRFEELKPDLLFFSGGDFLSKEESSIVLEYLSSRGLEIGVKHNVRERFIRESLDHVNTVLLEIRTLTDLRIVERFLKNLSDKIHLEMLIDEISEDPEKRIIITPWIRDLCKAFPEYYKAFYMADKTDNFIERYASIISKLCDNQFYIVASHYKFTPEIISCLRCGLQIANRIEGVIVNPFIDSKNCPRCGFRIFFREFDKNRIRKRFIYSRIVI
ncbi:MAG: hypothetical protein ABWJ42_02455 [Sulfolobales archaeon]